MKIINLKEALAKAKTKKANESYQSMNESGGSIDVRTSGYNSFHYVGSFREMKNIIHKAAFVFIKGIDGHACSDFLRDKAILEISNGTTNISLLVHAGDLRDDFESGWWDDSNGSDDDDSVMGVYYYLSDGDFNF